MPPPPPLYYLQAYSLSESLGSSRRSRVHQKSATLSKEERLASFDLSRLPLLSHVVFNYGKQLIWEPSWIFFFFETILSFVAIKKYSIN